MVQDSEPSHSSCRAPGSVRSWEVLWHSPPSNGGMSLPPAKGFSAFHGFKMPLQNASSVGGFGASTPQNERCAEFVREAGGSPGLYRSASMAARGVMQQCRASS